MAFRCPSCESEMTVIPITVEGVERRRWSETGEVRETDHSFDWGSIEPDESTEVCASCERPFVHEEWLVLDEDEDEDEDEAEDEAEDTADDWASCVNTGRVMLSLDSEELPPGEDVRCLTCRSVFEQEYMRQHLIDAHGVDVHSANDDEFVERAFTVAYKRADG